MATARTRTPPPALDGLPHDALTRVATFLALPDLAAANATARLFHAAPPGGCSPVEHALRERTRARGHERALPPTLPAGVRTWVEELFLRERVLELACVHAAAVATGNGFSAFVDAEGGLHTCGEEPVWDGHGHWLFRAHEAIDHTGMQAVRVPTHVASLGGVRVVAVAAREQHLLALSEAGAVYGCGCNTFGQLGLGGTAEQVSVFALAKLPATEPILAISAGDQHSLALSAAGCAYSWGDNEYGQLGHGDTEQRWEPTRIEALDGVRTGGVAAGHSYTLMLSAHGAVYSCGDGSSGKLGHGDWQDQHTPRRIEALAGVRAVHVSAGYAHSLVVGSEGAVYSFGDGEDGVLGHAGRDEQLAPRRIDALAAVRAVRACAGSGCSAVLGADGSVHTFGDNTHGQLGRRGKAASKTPARVGVLAQARVVRCAMGGSHSLFVSADGSVYACGERSAALGLGMSAAEQDAPTQRIAKPTCVETGWRARVC